MERIHQPILALLAIAMLSGCNILKVSAPGGVNVGQELLNLHEAHEKQIIGDAEYEWLLTRVLDTTRDTDNQQLEGKNENMVHVIAFIKVKPGQRDALIETFNKNVPNVLAEDGCIQYTLTVDTDSGIDVQKKDGNTVTVIEKWESAEALRAHLASPHMDQYRKDTEGMTEGVDLRVLQDT